VEEAGDKRSVCVPDLGGEPEEVGEHPTAQGCDKFTTTLPEVNAPPLAWDRMGDKARWTWSSVYIKCVSCIYRAT
jgi:hypothetical protein